MKIASADDSTTSDQVVTDIVSAVSQAEGIDSTEVRPPLNETVDVEALAALLESANRPVSVTFEYRNQLIEVRKTDDVEVTLDARN